MVTKGLNREERHWAGLPRLTRWYTFAASRKTMTDGRLMEMMVGPTPMFFPILKRLKTES